MTTPSLHALQLYSQASAFLHGQDWKNEPAEELLKQAVTEDPAFASAYILLAHAIHNQGRPKEAFMPHAERATALAAQTTDVERYFILGSYQQLVAGVFPPSVMRGEEAERELRKAIAAYEALIRITPDHYWGTNDLANALWVLSGPNRATAHAFARAAEIRPDDPSLNVRAATLLIQTGDVDGARRYLRRAQAVASWSDFTSYLAADLRARLALLDRDVGRARSIADELAGRLPGIKLPVSRNAGSAVSGPVLSAFTFGNLEMVDELKDLAAKVKDDHSQTPPDLLEIDAHVAVAEGRIEDVVRLFQSAKGGKISDPVALWRMAWPLARALRSGGNEAEAARSSKR